MKYGVTVQNLIVHDYVVKFEIKCIVKHQIKIIQAHHDISIDCAWENNLSLTLT